MSASKTSQIISMLNGPSGVFQGQMIQINIEPFTFDETKKYIEEKSNNIQFTEDAFNRFYSTTLGIPIYINSLCSILPDNSVCDERIILENIELNIDHIAIMWIYAWERLNTSEKEIVISLVENDELSWKTLNEDLSFTKPTISKYLDTL